VVSVGVETCRLLGEDSEMGFMSWSL